MERPKDYLGYPKRKVELVFCVDTTESSVGIIEVVKKEIIRAIKTVLDEIYGLEPSLVNARLISFKSYEDCGENAIKSTSFFSNPLNNADFLKALDSLEISGGARGFSNGFEAFYEALYSDWDSSCVKDYQFIIHISTASAVILGTDCDYEFYPKNMPRTEEEFFKEVVYPKESGNLKINPRKYYNIFVCKNDSDIRRFDSLLPHSYVIMDEGRSLIEAIEEIPDLIRGIYDL